MPFDRPTLTELVARTEADAEARLGTDALLPVSNLAVLARVLSGAVHGLHGHLDWISQQILPDSAEQEWLERHASIRALARTTATYATGDVIFTGIDGASIASGAQVARADGVTYTTTAAGTVSGGSVTVPVQADVAGDSGDAAAGANVHLVSPVSGVDSQGTVAAGGLTGGADEESDAGLRERLLAVIRQPPHGGADFDYLAWTYAASGDVTRIWVYPQELATNGVTVRFMTDGATVDGVPDSGTVDMVQSYIDARRPVTADVTVVAPVATELDLTIAVEPDSTAVRAAIVEAFADFLLRDGEPGGTIRLSRLREAISGAAGEEYHALTSPSADVTFGAGEIPVPGTITWV